MTYYREHIAQVLNQAADDIVDAAELPDEGARDALNLLVNVAMRRLDDPIISVTATIEDGYDADPDEVLSWLHR